MKEQIQTTTARLKTSTKQRAEIAKARFKFSTLESAIDTFILLGIRAYRQQLNNNLPKN